MEFDGKVVIITGSTSGIGKQIALDFAKNGAKVVINGRNASRLHSTIEQCKEISPSKQTPLGVIADVTNDEECKRIINTAITNFGKIDILVNNSGEWGDLKSVEDPSMLAEFDKLIKTNLRPTVVMSSLAIPHLVSTKGCIVNISGNAALKPKKMWMAQYVPESAKCMITRSMALELGPKGVRVNCVRPAFIKTPAYEKNGFVFEDIEDLKKQPLAKLGEPEDVAHCVLFLASEKSAFITGAAIDTSGGINDV